MDGGDGGQTEGARADDHRQQLLARPTGRRSQGSVHGARGRLDHDGRLVAPPVRHLVELQGVGDERQRPASSRVGAVPRLEAGLQMAADQAFAVVGLTRLARWARRIDAPHPTVQDRFDVHPPAVRGVTNHLVTRHEGEGDDVLEVTRAASVQCGEIGPADPGADYLDEDLVGARALQVDLLDDQVLVWAV